MEYLNRAELYAESRGNLEEFRELYIELREHNSVGYSVWKTLYHLYGSYVADTLELNSDI